MRHGRKSKSKRFNGYKRHIATDLDTDLILACAITPANRPEEEAAPALQRRHRAAGAARSPSCTSTAATSTSPLVDEVLGRRRRGRLPARGSRGTGSLRQGAPSSINMRDLTITCPAGETERIAFGSVVEFDPEACDHCQLARAVHRRRAGQRPHRHHRRERAAPAAAAQAASRPRAAAPRSASASRVEHQPRPPRPPPGPPRPLPRRAQEPLRPAPRLRPSRTSRRSSARRRDEIPFKPFGVLREGHPLHVLDEPFRLLPRIQHPPPQAPSGSCR